MGTTAFQITKDECKEIRNLFEKSSACNNACGRINGITFRTCSGVE